MSYDRDENGVRVRVDGKGDTWADAHRAVGRNVYMNDLDGYFGFVAFSGNTGDKLFLEFEPDAYENRQSESRRFGLVAMFDRKSNERAAFCEHNKLSSNLYRFICRNFSAVQPVGPRFFYVIGGIEPPWTMIEVDLNSGTEKSRVVLNGMNWQSVWLTTGLLSERAVLRRWLCEAKEKCQ